MINEAGRRFFVTGGTLRADAPSYVERAADHELLAGLLAGDFCYVLTSRQMGKSSLMVRTAQKLRERGVRVVALDLTAIGLNLTSEQWYAGLLIHAGKQAGREDELEAFWDAHHQLGPCQRFFAGLQELLDPPGSVNGAPWVVFVDEIDAVRSLPFSTDEFFAAIREWHNRRGQEPELANLTFCLLGVAAPTDLVRDTRTTPFNIGRRIELTDFTVDEALPLAHGLERHIKDDPRQLATAARNLVRRVVHWTGGHPYLTQRFCAAVAEANADALDNIPDIRGDRAVDHLCERLFLNAQARERDDNLVFVRERLLQGETDRVALLDLYRKVRRGRRVAADDTNPLVTALRLAGIVRLDARGMAVRNRIYAHVFDEAWVAQNLPDAELRRQREAFRLGVLRTASLATLILALVGALGLYAQRNAWVRQQSLVRLYNATGARRLDAGDVLGALPWFAAASRLTAQSPADYQLARLRVAALLSEAPRLVQLWTLAEPGSYPVNDVDFNAVTNLLVAAGDDGFAYVWNTQTGRRIGRFRHDQAERKEAVRKVRFSPAGQHFFSLDTGHKLRVWDLAGSLLRWSATNVSDVVYEPGGRRVITAGRDGWLRWRQAETGDLEREVIFDVGEPSAFDECHCVVSADGTKIAVVGPRGLVQILDLTAGFSRPILQDMNSTILDLAFSPDGRFLAAGGTAPDNAPFGGQIRLWSADDDWQTPLLMTHNSWVHRVAFNPAGNLLLSCSSDMTARLWHVETVASRLAAQAPGGVPDLRGRPASSPLRHQHAVRYAEFSPTGRYVVTASFDGTARVWDSLTGEQVSSPLTHYGNVVRARFAPDEKHLVTAGSNGAVKLWEMPGGQNFHLLGKHAQAVTGLQFDRTGKRLLTWGHDGAAIVWDWTAGRSLCRVPHSGEVNDAAWSPDGRWFATADDDGRPGLWWTTNGTRVVEFTAFDTNQYLAYVAFDPSGLRLATGGYKGQIALWDCTTGAQLPPALRAGGTQILQLAFNPAGTLLAAASGSTNIQLWDLRSHAFLTNLSHTSLAEGVAFSPNGNRLLVSVRDDSLDPASAWVWDLPRKGLGTGALTRHELPHYDGVTMSAYSPSGALIATASEDGTARLWDAKTLKPMSAPLVGGYQVRAARFSADSRILLTWAGSRTFRLWDTRDGEPLTAPILLTNAAPARVTCCDLSPDGAEVAIGADDGSVYRWRLTGESLNPEALTDRVEIQAGYRLDANAVPVPLDGRELQELWRKTRARAAGSAQR